VAGRRAPRPSRWAQRLPIGERLGLDKVIGNELFPFEGEIRTKPLDSPVLPEPERRGRDGVDCYSCVPSGEEIWEDPHWWLRVPREPSGLPLIAILIPRAHHDLEDLPLPLAAEMGQLLPRVSRAIHRIANIGRVHINRWGDGSEHLHLWLVPRPEGMWQMRGAMLAVWDDILPPIPKAEWNRNRRTVARALADDGGRALV
jgi:diadenosine tetraphosphate (Ap4A) HIT family hydrolase